MSAVFPHSSCLSRSAPALARMVHYAVYPTVYPYSIPLQYTPTVYPYSTPLQYTQTCLSRSAPALARMVHTAFSLVLAATFISRVKSELRASQERVKSRAKSELRAELRAEIRAS